MLHEFYRRADKIMCLEIAREAVCAGKPAPTETSFETAQTRKPTPTEKSRKNKKHKNGDRRRSPEANNKKAKSPDQRVLIPPPSKYTNFTYLTRLREKVFLATEQRGVYKQLDQLRGNHFKRNQNKYCRYHKDVGHTKECIMLKDEIKKLICDGYLRDYVRNGNAMPRTD